ncbi:MAG: hypothetical protein WA440_14855, partial [Ignavibacteriaceae bacterium]
VLRCSDKIKDEEVEKVDPLNTFKEFIGNHLDSYKKDKRKRITLLGGGWVNLYYEPESTYKIDVQKTNSLVTPNTGFCEFTLIRHFTAFHKNKSDAINDTVFIKSDKTIHRHHYGFQDNKWVVTSREHMMISSILNNDWYDCDEIVQEGEQKGITNIYGCWEK